MDRRRYLALLPALFAGCGQPGGDETPTISPMKTATPESTPSATASPPETETVTETDVPTEGDPPTDTETATPDPGTKLLTEAESLLAASVEAYLAVGESADSLTDVFGDATVSKRDVRGPLYEARDVFEDLEAEDLTDGQTARFQQVRGAHWFLWWLPPAHNGVHDVFERIAATWNRMEDRDWFAARNRITDVPDRVSIAERELRDINSDSDPEDMNGFDRLTPADYTAKLEQFDDELTDAESLATILREMVQGFEQYDAGGTNGYFDARRSFLSASASLDDGDWASAYTTIVDDAVCVADAMAAGCAYLDRAVQSEDDGEEERADALRAEANEAFAECDLLVEEFGIGD